MNYVMTSVAILMLILSLCLLFTWLSDRYLEENRELLHDAADFLPMEDWDSVITCTEDAEEHWDAHKAFFRSLLDHQELEDIDRAFVSLLAYARSEETNSYYVTYTRLLSMLEHIQEMDDPKLYNILAPIVNHRCN